MNKHYVYSIVLRFNYQFCFVFLTKEIGVVGMDMDQTFSHSWFISSMILNKAKAKVLATQLCPTLCDPTNCNPPGSSVHGILQAGILEWIVIPFSRGSSQPRDQTQVSHIAGRFFAIWATREAFHDWNSYMRYVSDKTRLLGLVENDWPKLLGSLWC